jgi:excisionase family DNA binding protein
LQTLPGTQWKLKRKAALNPAKEVMDIKDLCAYLGIGKSKIYALIRERKIPASRIGRQYRFSKEVIDSWLKENLITAEPQMDFFGKSKTSSVGTP